MRLRDVERHLRENGCLVRREGSRYWNPVNRQTSTVPRHNEIKDFLFVKICKDLGVPRDARP
jgi:hypothetical protein